MDTIIYLVRGSIFLARGKAYYDIEVSKINAKITKLSVTFVGRRISKSNLDIVKASEGSSFDNISFEACTLNEDNIDKLVEEIKKNIKDKLNRYKETLNSYIDLHKQDTEVQERDLREVKIYIK